MEEPLIEGLKVQEPQMELQGIVLIQELELTNNWQETERKNKD